MSPRSESFMTAAAMAGIAAALLWWASEARARDTVMGAHSTAAGGYNTRSVMAAARDDTLDGAEKASSAANSGAGP